MAILIGVFIAGVMLGVILGLIFSNLGQAIEDAGDEMHKMK